MGTSTRNTPPEVANGEILIREMTAAEIKERKGGA